MFRNLTLRTKLVAIVVPPLVVLAVVAAYGVLLGFRGADSLDQLTADVRVLGVTALASFLLSALAVIVIGRTITDPLDELSGAADELANVRLPLLVESLRTPGMDTPEFAPLEIDQQNDEMGKLVAALNSVQDSAAQVATEQQNLVRQGLSELVVNLARRNQSLLDRQIEFIDKLESNEEDPDRLEELFGLDHLATRMRRNAESLLVLAGAEPARRRGGPVAVADILRVAMSEIEDYRHVHLMQIDDAEIGASAAVDLAHLLSEVMENATQFSPPESPVEVNGIAQSDGCYLITVADHGLGMTDEQITASNHILSHPPELGLSLSRSLGFIVIGRLAQRLEVEVELAYTEGGGITALVLVPMSILTGGDQLSVDTLPAPPAAAVEPADQSALPAPVLPDAAIAAPSDEPAWQPPAMPDRGNPFGEQAQDTPPPPAPAPAAPVPAPSAEAPQSDALAKLLGVSSAPEPPAPTPFDPSSAFGVTPEAPEAPQDEAAPFDTAPPIEAAPFDTAPPIEAAPFDTAPPIEADQFDMPAAPSAMDFDPPPPADTSPLDMPAEPSAMEFDPPPPTDTSPFEPQAGDPFAPPAGAPDPFAPAIADEAPPAPNAESLLSNAPSELGTDVPDFGTPDLQSTAFDENTFGATDAEPFDSSFGSPTFDPPGVEAGDPFAQPATAPQEDIWQGPNFGAPETVPGPADAAPSHLEQAIPSGESFDSGMASLLDAPAPAADPGTTTSGLVKRDRSKSQAPTSEGRPIKASARSPEEVRQMLARYRDGRNRPTGEAPDPTSDYQSGEQS